MNTRSLAKTLPLLAALAFCLAAAPNDSAWKKESRPNRILLDWQSSDMPGPDRTAELFLDTAKFSAAAGGAQLSAGSFTFVAEKADGAIEEMPFDAKEEVGQFNRHGLAFRMVPPAGAKRLWMYFGGAPAAATPLATKWNVLDGFFDSSSARQWHSSQGLATVSVENGSALRISYDDKNDPTKAPWNFEITRSFAIPQESRGTDAFLSLDLKGESNGYVPLSILLKQFGKDGKKLDACVVDPRWVTMCVASGQDIRLREKGFIHPSTASITVSLGLWARQARDGIMQNDGSWLKYPISDSFKLEITKAELRTATPINFPGYEPSFYAPGLTGAADDLALTIKNDDAFCFDGNPPAVWSEGGLPADAHSYHWPTHAGTFECWIYPEWKQSEGGKRYIIDAMGGIAAANDLFEIFYTPDSGTFHVNRADLSGKKSYQEGAADMAPGQWHHIACTWDSATSHQELFVDGRRVMSHSGDPIPAIDVTKLNSAKEIPGRIWIGNSRTVAHGGSDSLHGRIDEIRVSDGIRYSGPFTPDRKAFVLDHDTRALFHFDGRVDGIHDGDDGRVAGAPLSETAQMASEIAYETRGSATTTKAKWSDADLPDAQNPLKLFDVKPYRRLNESDFSKSFVEHSATFHVKPGDTTSVNCAGEPQMEWVELRCPDTGTTLSAPFLAKDGEVDSRSLASMVTSLGVAHIATDREKADAIFKYLISSNNYYWTVTYDVQPNGSMIDPGNCPLLFLNGYLQFGCGNQNTLLRDAFLEAGMTANLTYGSAHLFEQVFYDGSWHLYDLTPRAFYPARDNARAASLAEVEHDPYLVVRGTGDPLVNYWIPSDTRKYHFNDRELALPDMTYRLRPGEAIRYQWDNAGRYNPIVRGGTEHSAPWKEGPTFDGRQLAWATHFPPYSANGVFSFSCAPRADHPALSDWHDGAFIYKFVCPYVVCGAIVNTSSDSATAPTIELSFNEGKTWTSAPKADGGVINLERLCADHHLYWIRVTPAAGGKIDHFEHQAIVLMNPKVLTPVLTKGANTLHFTADSGSASEVTIQYREEADSPLEIVGGARFGWVEGHERQLLVGQPGKTLTFDIKQCSTEPSIVVPSGIKATVAKAGDDNWHATVDVLPSIADGLYELNVKAGERSRSAALLIAKDAVLSFANEASRQGNVSIGDDSEGVHGKVLSLRSGGAATFSLEGAGTEPLALFALAEIPNGNGAASLQLSSGASPIIQANYAHTFWEQEYLQTQWKWYHVRVGGYPYESLAGVKLPEQNAATIKGLKGQTLVDAVLVLPADNERLIEGLTQYLFSANYEPWRFQRDWGPITAGVPYVVK